MSIKLSNYSQLFLDDYLVSRLRNLKRDMKQPVKHPSNPLIVRRYPWENSLLRYSTVMCDEDWSKFRCWYMTSNGRPVNSEDTRRFTKSWIRYDDWIPMGYAESTNGIRWTRPMVGPFPFDPFKKHNLVIPAGHGACILKTPWDPDPNRLYKVVGGPLFATSPNGIH